MLETRVELLSETNPMLGHRGCRLGISFPEIYEMQFQAILEAAMEVMIENKKTIIPEIMIPFVSGVKEISFLKNIFKKVQSAVIKKYNHDIVVKIGCMIEIPAAVFNIVEIIQEVDFVSFGTNDLTQTVMGISRDDSNNFVPNYIDKGIFLDDPFVSINESTVGKAMKYVILEIKKHNPNIKVGICGEHAGDHKSIMFCQELGIDYISCSPHRVITSKISAAISSLSKK